MTATDSLTPSASAPLSSPADTLEWLDGHVDTLGAMLEAEMARILREHAGAYLGVTAAAGDPSQLDGMEAEWSAFVETEVGPYVSTLYRATALSTTIAASPPPRIAALMTPVINESAVAYSRVATNRIVGAGNALWGNVRSELTTTLQTGGTMEELKETVERVTGYSEFRADTIARTEVMGAYNHGDNDAAQSLGEYGPIEKQWLAALDARTRESHVEANGQTVPFNADFMVGGNAMPFPGQGPPEEVVNCRCVVLHLYAGDQRPDGSTVGESTTRPPQEPELAESVEPGRTQAAQVEPTGFRVGEQVGLANSQRAELSTRLGSNLAGRYNAALADTPFEASMVSFDTMADGTMSWNTVVTHPDRGVVGSLTRSVYQHEGKWQVEHNLFTMERGMQGQGVAARMNQAAEAFYREMGIDSITLHANIDVGGYAWAKQGYGWDPQWRNTSRFIKKQLGRMDDQLRYFHDLPGYHAYAEWTPEMVAQATDDLAALQAKVAAGGTPSPAELALVGHVPGATTWVGKETMLQSSWYGAKPL